MLTLARTPAEVVAGEATYGAPRHESAIRTPHAAVVTHVDDRCRVRRGMPPDPDKADPTNQSGRPWMVTAVPIGLLLALAALVVVFFLAR